MNKQKISLGVIGMSKGNGHPYSWSAICNGYNKEAMSTCPFPVIPEYLEKQIWPEARIQDIEVTHIWTQDLDTSIHIAKASKIQHIVEEKTDMIGKIDALLLARDDAENHYDMCYKFLDAGIPVYIDKPIATTLKELDKIYQHQQYEGQIFSCSALRYAIELENIENIKQEIGNIIHVTSITPKQWETYGVHIVDPIVSSLGLSNVDFSVTAKTINGCHVCNVHWENSLDVNFISLKEAICPISVTFFGERGYKKIEFSDAFTMFKKALEKFLYGIRNNIAITPYESHKTIVSIIEQGI